MYCNTDDKSRLQERNRNKLIEKSKKETEKKLSKEHHRIAAFLISPGLTLREERLVGLFFFGDDFRRR
jgi:hypothetical protein